ncbi:MAG: hypothetical protein II738_07730, partial [Clostridia bacterium]|nr:hypothetical protein [Clostridia bacterium]
AGVAKREGRVCYAPAFAALTLLPLPLLTEETPGAALLVGSAVLLLATAVPAYLAAKCLYNYASVYVPLSQSEGFPNFIVTASDRYASQMYLRDEPAAVRDAPAQKAQPLVMDIEDDGAARLRRKEGRTSWPYGFSVFGVPVIFQHDDMEKMTKSEKRDLMFLWNDSVDRIAKPYPFLLFFQLFCMMIAAVGGMAYMIPFFLVILLFPFAISGLRLQERFAPHLLLVCYCLFFLQTLLSLQVIYIAAFYFANALLLLPGCLRTVRLLLNNRLFQRLKREEGYPSFLVDRADMEREALEKMGKLPEPTKSPDKAWNAFDQHNDEP